MDTREKHIVAIDLGTSSIAITVAKVNGNDVQIVYYKETPSAGIRYSSVFNASQVAEPLSRAIRSAEDALGIRITQAVVGMPKFAVRQETSTGKVKGHLLTDKIFVTSTSTGKVRVPSTESGGICKVTTSTGDILFD